MVFMHHRNLLFSKEQFNNLHTLYKIKKPVGGCRRTFFINYLSDYLAGKQAVVSIVLVLGRL